MDRRFFAAYDPKKGANEILVKIRAEARGVVAASSPVLIDFPGYQRGNSGKHAT